VKPKEGGALQGAALTKFLLNVQEYDLAAAKMGRRPARAAPGGPAGVERSVEKKTDFEDKKALEKLLKAIDKAKLDLDAKIAYDEEHSLYDLVIPGAPARPRRKENQLGVRRHTGVQAPARIGQSGQRGGIVRPSL